MFRVGEWYSFLVTKVIDVPGNGNHYVLKHVSGEKLLLPAKYYVKYNFSVNSIIRCKVDKINCTGQVFIEPEHPVYKVGNSYDFKVKKIEPWLHDQALKLVVTDVFDNSLEVVIPEGNLKAQQKSVHLKVVDIKKGLPVISSTVIWNCSQIFKKGEKLELFLHGTANIQGEEYYILIAKSNCLAMLKVKHYLHYSFKPSTPIFAIYFGIDANGLLKVNPEHPYYKEGELYSFQISGFELEFNNNSGSSKVAVVFDKYGMKCGVKIENEKHYRIGDSIMCRVLGFKKGRPLLDIAPQQ
ncbi:MAG TPA: hypothetical protein DDY04_02965 [Bacteroidales bacterium]|nr:hypothetical protein [Bacteroidales bacterium]